MIPEAETMLDRIIANYRLKRILGKGGSSVVFLGQKLHDPLNQAAIKVLWPSSFLSAAEVNMYHKRFLREAQILQERLRHPHIVPVLAYGEDPHTGVVFMIMPYIRRETLTERARNAPLPLGAIGSYVLQLADALDHAHRQQVLHRDLKPNNVLLDEWQQIYLLDFGIAKLVDSEKSRITAIGGVIGTPDYMAPEQARGGAVSVLSDVYGLGALTYTLVTGKGLFLPAAGARMLLQVLSKAPVPPRAYRPDLPADAEAVILCALSKDPFNRFATAGAFARAFIQAIRMDGSIRDMLAPIETFSAPHYPAVAGDATGRREAVKPAITTQERPVVRKVRRLMPRRTILAGVLAIAGISGSILWAANASFTRNALSRSMGSSNFSPVSHITQFSATPYASSSTGGTVFPLTSTSATPQVTYSFGVEITNLPANVVNNTKISVGVHTSFAPAKVVLHVTYSSAKNIYDSLPVSTDAQGFAVIAWPVHVSLGSHHHTVANIVVTATDDAGYQTVSVSAHVTVNKST